MRIPSVIHTGFFTLCWALLSPNTWAQSGSWVLDGWPDERNGYFAGRTEIYADGDRLKIVEWPGAVQQDDEALETYHLGRSVVKVFTWHGERVGLVFESEAPLPKAEVNSEGRLVLPAPYPPPSQSRKRGALRGRMPLPRSVGGFSASRRRLVCAWRNARSDIPTVAGCAADDQRRIPRTLPHRPSRMGSHRLLRMTCTVPHSSPI